MSQVHHGLVILTGAFGALSLTREQVLAAAGGELLDETEGSLTLTFSTKKALDGAATKVGKLGLKQGEHTFALHAEVPSWLDDYREAASAMIEHGG
jgi:hypothetical protein